MKQLKYTPNDLQLRNKIRDAIADTPRTIHSFEEAADAVMKVIGRPGLETMESQIKHAAIEQQYKQLRSADNVLEMFYGIIPLLKQRNEAMLRKLDENISYGHELTYEQYIEHCNEQIKKVMGL